MPAATKGTLLYLYIRVVDDKSVTGMSDKYGDFNFIKVIEYPVPQSSINYLSGYTTFYSQLIHFLDFEQHQSFPLSDKI